MAYLTEGIKKLRAVYVKMAKEKATATTRLWRGMRNLDIGDKFMENNMGGTEVVLPTFLHSCCLHDISMDALELPVVLLQVAPMSTTTDMRVAIQYGLSAGSLLFMLKVGLRNS